MNKKILGLPIWFLLTIVSVFASITIIGQAISEMKIIEELDIGQRKIGEKVERIIATVNETITDSVNVSTTCLGGESITMTLKNPEGSGISSTVLNLNGTVSIQAQGVEPGIVPGNITLLIDHKKQGGYECVIDFDTTNNTIVNWVTEL